MSQLGLCEVYVLINATRENTADERGGCSYNDDNSDSKPLTSSKDCNKNSLGCNVCACAHVPLKLVMNTYISLLSHPSYFVDVYSVPKKKTVMCEEKLCSVHKSSPKGV